MNKKLKKYLKDMIPFELIQEYGRLALVIIVFVLFMALLKWLQIIF
jgi:hypothetical protein